MKYPFTHHARRWSWASFGLISLLLFTCMHPVLAHPGGPDIHAFDGLWAGLLHPFMGVDHLTLITAAGLLAAKKHGGIVWAFTSASLAGIGFALGGMVLPSLFAGAIALFILGILLIKANTVTTSILLGGVAIAGFCYGYPHGALLTTVSSSAQVTFLLSFILAQLTLGYISCGITRRLLSSQQNQSLLLPGLGICGVGFAYLSAAFLF